MRVTRVIGVLEAGGAQLSALRLSLGLGAAGIQTVRLLAGHATAGGLAMARRYGVGVETYVDTQQDQGVPLQWRYSEEFADWLTPRLADADLVHAHMLGAWMAAAQAIPAGTPLVASEHNAVTWPHGDFSVQARIAAARIDAFFAHGPAAREFAIGLGLDAERLHEGRSAVEGLDATPLPGLAAPRVTFTGRLHPDKGPDLFLEALARTKSSATGYIVGDGPAAAAVAGRTRDLGLGDSVRLVGWSDEPARYVAGSAVHVVPSRQEAWSQSAVIGMGLGVPVIGSAVEGLPITLGQGRGILVPAEDPDALACAIDAAIDGSSRPDPAHGRDYARGYSVEAVSLRYAAVYAALVRDPSTRRAAREPAGFRAARL